MNLVKNIYQNGWGRVLLIIAVLFLAYLCYVGVVVGANQFGSTGVSVGIITETNPALTPDPP